MRTPVGTALALVAATAAAGLLAGCGLLGPTRNAEGRVTGTSIINSTDLLVGDCFSFTSNADHAKASVTPCSADHSFVVIGVGTLTADQVASGGGLQNAVSAACAAPFATFKAKAAKGVRPQQEFIVTTVQKDGKDLTAYHCVASDTPATPASPATPSS